MRLCMHRTITLCGAGIISQYTCPHSRNAEIGNYLFLEVDTKFGSKSIKLDHWKTISNQQGSK
jgi:hypothetical protein